MATLRLALVEKPLGDLGAAFRHVTEVSLVVPHGFEAADAAEGRQLYEEVGVEVKKLAD